MTRKFGGTGLGLSISSQLVKLMNGKIWVESPSRLCQEGGEANLSGPGATFYFTCRFAIQHQPSSYIPLMDVRKLKGLSVLVVDDNPANRRFLEELLFNMGMKPTCIDDPGKVLSALEDGIKQNHPFSLLLLDQQMPEMDGFTLAQAIRAKAPFASVPMLLLTSSGQRGDAARCRQIGINGYLIKPVIPSELFGAILLVMSFASHHQGAQKLVTRHTLREYKAVEKIQNELEISLREYQLHILLAEDNLVNQKFAVRMLEKMGFQVTVAENGRQAVQLWEKQHFDLILMDVQMPDMNGFEATKYIREKEQITGTHIPIIALTAHAMKGYRESCLAAGMDGYVSKPIKKVELL
ncbi:MAG: response regulator, partial [Methanobacteriota archaeon]